MKFILKDESRTLYQCDSSDLYKLNYSEINRKPDITRVTEILAILDTLNNNSILPSPLLEGYFISNKVYLIDGFHRFTAMKKCDKNFKFLLSVFDARKMEPKQEFIRINSSIPVSELYTLDSNTLNKELYENIVDYYQKQYPRFFKASKNPQKPYTNRDKFLELLFESDTEYNFDKVIQLFSELSDAMKLRKYSHGETKEDQKIKNCLKHNFWLFWAEPHEMKRILKPTLINLN